MEKHDPINVLQATERGKLPTSTISFSGETHVKNSWPGRCIPLVTFVSFLDPKQTARKTRSQAGRDFVHDAVQARVPQKGRRSFEEKFHEAMAALKFLGKDFETQPWFNLRGAGESPSTATPNPAEHSGKSCLLCWEDSQVSGGQGTQTELEAKLGFTPAWLRPA